MGCFSSARLATFFGQRRILLIAAALGLLIALPSLGSGFFLDDYCHRVILLSGQNTSLFDWYRTGSARTDAMLQSGLLPWWMYPDSKLVFFRPLAEWLIKLDYLLWPDSAPLMHLHSIVWYVALIAATGCAYRRLMPAPAMVGLAIVMFALDAGHSSAVAWLANRNSLVAMTGSMCALLCYMQGRWSWWLLGCLLYGLTLGCAEAALAITGYFFAYEVFLSNRPWGQRIARLAPYALISVVWLAFWYMRGYGNAGPGIYTDPSTDPIGFLRNMIYRGPFLLFGQLSMLPVEVLSAFDESPLRPYLLIVALIAIALLAKLLWPFLKKSPVARFYALGMGIALIPICGVQLFGRSLIYVSFGALGLLGMFFHTVFFDRSQRQTISPVVPVLLLVLHIVISPLLFLSINWLLPTMDHFIDARTIQLPDVGGAEKKVLALSVDNYETNIFFPLMRDKGLSLGAKPTRAVPTISRIRALSIGNEEFELLREDQDTLVIRGKNGFEKMRKGIYGFGQGAVVELDDVTITILEVSAERTATAIEYRFKPGVLHTYEVIDWNGQKFVSSRLPAPGQAMRIKATRDIVRTATDVNAVGPI